MKDEPYEPLDPDMWHGKACWPLGIGADWNVAYESSEHACDSAEWPCKTTFSTTPLMSPN